LRFSSTGLALRRESMVGLCQSNFCHPGHLVAHRSFFGENFLATDRGVGGEGPGARAGTGVLGYGKPVPAMPR